jgi:hypothetical protein
MNQVALKKISEREKKVNTQVLEQFKRAFLNKDMEEMEDLFHEKGVFFNRKNKHKVLAYLHKCFKQVSSIEKGFHIEILEGYSFDYFPCEPVLEFRYPDFNPFEDDLEKFKSSFGSEENNAYNEIVFRFAFDFRDDKIYKLRRPSLCAESLDRYIRMN